jgi:tripartite-type tricarboxylate transporter receptor subunit TctC
MRVSRPTILFGALVAAFSAMAAPAAAQSFPDPSKPIHLIVPTSPSGITDIMARIMADHVGNTLGAKIIVENKPAGGGNVAINQVAKSPPDGYTLLIINVGQITCNPWLYKDLQFDTLKDLTGVAPVGAGPSLLVINDKLPVKTAKEFVEYAKANPGKLNYGSAGNATMPHIVAEQFNHVFGVNIQHIPYRGAAPAAVGLGSNEVQAGFIALGTVRPQFQAGTIRILAVVSDKRLEELPNVPTFDEAGLHGFDLLNWFGVMAPAGTPAAAVDTINAAMKKMSEDPAILKRYREGGIVAMWEPAAKFNARIRADHEKYGKIIKTAGIKIE